MKKRTIAILSVVFLMDMIVVHAQPNDILRAKAALQTLADHYKNYASLSFSVEYRYAAADRPAQFLDSLHGQFEIIGPRYRYILDSTEFIGDSGVSLALFRQDRIIYMSRRSANPTALNPMSMLDSLIVQGDSVKCTVREDPQTQTIRLEFPGDRPVKQIEYAIERPSGLLSAMRYMVNAKELYDPSVRGMIHGGDTYAIVEAIFGHYREEVKDKAMLEWAHYVRKQDGRYISLAPYQAYKVFVGSPGL